MKLGQTQSKANSCPRLVGIRPIAHTGLGVLRSMELETVSGQNRVRNSLCTAPAIDLLRLTPEEEKEVENEGGGEGGGKAVGDVCRETETEKSGVRTIDKDCVA